MAMDAGEIERLIKAKFPDALVEIRDLAGDGDHYAAHVVSAQFKGKSRVQQHQMIYEALGGRMGGALHALGPHHCGAVAAGASDRELTSRRQSTHCALERAGARPADKRTFEGAQMSNPQQDVQDWIRKTVAANDVVLFMKGNKNMPQCGFSAQVDHILRALGIDYKDINVLQDMAIRDGIKAYSNWPTIPQLYVKGEFVGGCDIVREMLEAGELTAMFDEKGIAYDKSKLTA